MTIHSKNLSFNGVIVAEEVKIATNKIEMVNTNADIYEKLANCKQTNATTFSMFYLSENNKIGVGYEEAYRTMDLYYRYDNEEFQCIEDFNTDTYLEIPKNDGYLEGYIIVSDRLGNEKVSNIVTFYNDGSCYEKFRDSDGDGIGDAYEIRDLATNPKMADSDGDNIIDAYDIYENKQYYDVKITLSKEVYERISEEVCHMFFVNEKESTQNEKVCYLKKSKLDSVNSYYNNDDILVTSVYNKITGKEILRFFDGKYIQYIYDNTERRIATLSSDGKNGIVNMYTYDEKGNLSSITHNDFTYDLKYYDNNLSEIKIAENTYANYTYDENGNVIKISYANGYESNIEYDEIGNILKISDGEKVLYEWKYGSHYILGAYIDYVNDTVTKYRYDDIGEISCMEDNKGRKVEYSFGDNDREKLVHVGTKDFISTFSENNTGSVVEYSNGLSRATGKGEEKQQVFSFEEKEIVVLTEKIVDNYKIKTIGTDEYKYLLAHNGNILEEYINGELYQAYEYDDFSQMTRVNSKVLNATILYEYDAGGNICCQKFYPLSFDKETKKLKKEIKTIKYTYDSDWKDLLVEYDRESIGYDEIGNPVSYIDGMNFEWEQGRNLSAIKNKNGEIATYTYNSDGIRTSKNINGNIVEYYLEDSRVLYEKGNDYEIYYIYDENNEIIGFEYNSEIYVYKKNITNDVIGIIDVDGKEIASYMYDAWGKILAVNGDTEIAKINPIRYKSYYYDEESGLYYLNSRYYDTKTGRFINADKHIDTGVGIHANNMFAYCENSPLIRENSTGESWVALAGALAVTALAATGCSSYEPEYNELCAWDKERMSKYNCYGYATYYFKERYLTPGFFSGKECAWSLGSFLECTIADLRKRGYSEVEEIRKADISSSKGVVIALRIGDLDFHFMKYARAQNEWYHKPGGTAVLKSKKAPYEYDVWYGEVFDGSWRKTNITYTSVIKYIRFK